MDFDDKLEIPLFKGKNSLELELDLLCLVLSKYIFKEALIRSPKGSSQNIVIILLVFPAVRRSLKDYLRIYSGKYLLIKIDFISKI
jgi:hypothetical protein